MSTVYPKQQNGKKILYYSVRYKDNQGRHQRYTESLGLVDNKRNRQIAKKIKEKKDKDFEERNYYPGLNAKLSTCFKQFIHTKRNRSERTVEAYQTAYNKFVRHIGDVAADHVTQGMVDEFEDMLRSKYSIYTVQSYMRDIHTFFNFMHVKGYVPKNIITKVKAPKRQIRVMKDSEVKQILKKLLENKTIGKDEKVHTYPVNYRHYYFVKFLSLSGFRKGEAQRLRWEDIDWDREEIYVRNQKGEREDMFPLYNELKRLFHEMGVHLNGSVFGYTKRYSLRSLEMKLKKITNGKWSPHDFRRYVATKWSTVVSASELKELMRHKSIETTMQYYVRHSVKSIKIKLNSNH